MSTYNKLFSFSIHVVGGKSCLGKPDYEAVNTYTALHYVMQNTCYWKNCIIQYYWYNILWQWICNLMQTICNETVTENAALW